MKTPIFHYSRDDLRNALETIGFCPGDIVSLQVSLGRLGILENTTSYEEIADIVLDTIQEVISPGGTLIVPCFTYSIGIGEQFEVEKTPSRIGAFPEIFRKRTNVLRSRDPMLSNCGFGEDASSILFGISNSCYGSGSVFDRLKEHKAKICTIGISTYWATYRHYIEEMANVPFRFHKKFEGTVIEEGNSTIEEWIYFAAPLNVTNCEPNGLPLEKLCHEAGLIQVANVGRGEIMVINTQDYFDFGMEHLRKTPWLSAKGPPCTIDTHIEKETF